MELAAYKSIGGNLLLDERNFQKNSELLDPIAKVLYFCYMNKWKVI